MAKKGKTICWDVNIKNEAEYVVKIPGCILKCIRESMRTSLELQAELLGCDVEFLRLVEEGKVWPTATFYKRYRSLIDRWIVWILPWLPNEEDVGMEDMKIVWL